jgi:hypothetical protein
MPLIHSLTTTVDFVIDEVKVGFQDRRAKSGFSGAPKIEYAAYAVMPGGFRCLLGSRSTSDDAREIIDAFIRKHGLLDASPRERLCTPMTVGEAATLLSRT